MSNNKQETAVEWSAEKLASLTFDYMAGLISKREYDQLSKGVIRQAKEMEKEQMLECYLKADVFPRKYEFEKWFNETYGGNK